MLECWTQRKLLTMDRVQSHRRFNLLNHKRDQRNETLQQRLRLRRVDLVTRNIRNIKNQASTAKSQAKKEIDQGLATTTKTNENLINLIDIQLSQNLQFEVQNRKDIAQEVVNVASLVIVDTVGISCSLSSFLDKTWSFRPNNLHFLLLSYTKENLEVLS